MDDKTKLIFLDIDGVLNSARAVTVFGDEATLDPVACGLLKKLLKETGAYIVVVSNWRRGLSLDDLRALLGKAAGKKIARRTIGKVSDAAVSRGDLVDAWLDAEHFTGKYVILDDKTDYGAGLLTHLVQPDSAVGLSLCDYDAVMAILGAAE